MEGKARSLREPALQQAYDRLVESGILEQDPAQQALITKLDDLLIELDRRRLASKSSSLGWLFSRNSESVQGPKGLYIWGEVGRGKTMLMDLFYDSIPGRRKKRLHFNDFMQTAQELIHRHREDFKHGRVKSKDPIPDVAKQLAGDITVLCFDEFTVTDIADAMILGRLFEAIFNNKTVIVATSNVEPDKLYQDGLNRDLFVPFINLLKHNVTVHELSARTDFRLEKLDQAPVYYTPADQSADAAMDKAWNRLTGTKKGRPVELALKGRTFQIPQAAAGVARLSFSALCEEARSAADYIALAHRFHTVLIDRVPQMNRQNHNAAKRFILLVDTLYDNHVRVVISADATPDKLYSATSGTEAFEFKRTASRLHEMQSREYMGGREAA